MDTNERSPGGNAESPAAGFVDFADIEKSDNKPERHEVVSSSLALRLFLLPLGFAFFLTCLFLAMRGIMDLGGMVASGGPYEIAHQAPGYVWIFPVAIISCTIIALASFTRRFSPSGLNLVGLLFWPAIFLSLGWNFLEYGFFKDGLQPGWIVCGILFMLMGGVPLYFLLKPSGNSEKSRYVDLRSMALLPQVIGLVIGIGCGILFFGAIS
jgi:hypothetical protein